MEASQKRKRDILSCQDCRRRKIKCDREVPVCGRCQRGGVAHLCTYESEPKQGRPWNEDDNTASPVNLPASEPRTFDTLSKHIETKTVHHDLATVVKEQAETIEQLGNRMKILESLVTKQLQSSQEASALPRDAGHGSLKMTTNGRESMLFRGKGFTTHFYGTTHPTSIYANFPEVRNYMAEIYPDSSLHRLRQECKALHVRGKSERTPQIITENLLTLMPPRLVADKLITLYFDTFETTYRILHKPSFWRDYLAYWEQPSEAPPGFSVLLLLAMATVRCAGPSQQPSFGPDGSAARSEAMSWIQACDVWLKQQSNKHRTMAMFQARLLRLIAASSNIYKAKEFYSEAENTLNYFKAAGMHRDPALLGSNCSIFEQEMRKRLWASAAELGLHGAINRGLPTSLLDLHIDCPAPLNIDDGDICETSTVLPASLPASEYTSASYLHISARSFPLRARLTSIVNHANRCLSFEEVFEEEKKIQGFLDALPLWGRPQQHASSLMEIELRQFIVFLHTIHSRKSPPNLCHYSRITSYNSSRRIIDLLHHLIAAEDFTLILARTDVLQVASLCHIAFLSTIDKDDAVLEYIKVTYTKTVEKALEILEESAIRTGCGSRYLWYISAWNGLVQQRMGSAHSVTCKERVMERVVKLYHLYLAFQDVPTPRLPLRSGFDPGTGETYGSHVSEVATGYAMVQDIPISLNDLDWTFDDFWSFDIPHI